MNSNEPLLKSLKELYAKLHIISLRQRIQDYFLNTQSHSHHDISATLHQLIDELVKDVSHNTVTNNFTEIKGPNRQSSNIQTLNSNLSEQQPEPVIHTKDSLSFYFRSAKAQEKDPSTAVMLRRRIWEHVHSARRLARKGDKHSATMHADIASEGLKTLAHYMPVNDHAEFLAIIVDQLSQKTSDNNFDSYVENNNGL